MALDAAALLTEDVVGDEWYRREMERTVIYMGVPLLTQLIVFIYLNLFRALNQLLYPTLCAISLAVKTRSIVSRIKSTSLVPPPGFLYWGFLSGGNKTNL